jgi:ribosomal protein S18 acetylase RimI-like enzyme
MTLQLQTLKPEDWRLFREVRLEALREAPYAFSATLSDWQGPADAEERWRNRLSNVRFNVIASLNGTPAGMISATAIDDQRIELLSTWVAPWARGQGIADALVNEVRRWANDQGCVYVVLGVYPSNSHAIRLYERSGFVVEPSTGDQSEELRMVHLASRPVE